MIGAAGHVLTRLRRIDFTQPLLSIQNQLEWSVAHVQVNPWMASPGGIGLPVAVCPGREFVMLPFLFAQPLDRLVGWAFSWWAYRHWTIPGTRFSHPLVSTPIRTNLSDRPRYIRRNGPGGGGIT